MHKKMIIACLLFSCLSPITTIMAMSSTKQMACVKTNQKEIAALFDRWNDSLKTKNPEKVNTNYTDNAILLATIASKPRVNSSERIAYFKDFLSKHPVGKIVSRTIKIGCNKAIDTGIYTFTLKDGKKIKARYTFTYRWNGNQWLISSHHSSVVPNDAS